MVSLTRKLVYTMECKTEWSTRVLAIRDAEL